MQRFQKICLILVMLLIGFSDTCMVQAQKHTVVIVDSLSGDPIPNLTVKQLGTDRGFVTNQFGAILFNTPPQTEDRFQLSCIGFENRVVSGKTIIEKDTLLLRSSMLELDEVIIRPVSPERFINQAMELIDQNYVKDSAHVKAYYREWLKENDHYLHSNEAWIEANQPGYQIKNDSFEIGLRAGRCDAAEELEFMRKEVEKDQRKQQKRAAKNNEELTEEDLAIQWEVVDPLLIMRLDPIRHPEVPMHVNDKNVDFLDSTSHAQYNFWYGKPVTYDELTLVVIHFEPSKRSKSPFFQGAVWIDQASMAFVKISFGFVPKAERKLLPAYAEALMWLYGLYYDLGETNIEMRYQRFNDRWALSSTHLVAALNLEKRRFFGENDESTFQYESELLVLSMRDELPKTLQNLFDPKASLTKQIEALSPNPWEALLEERRQIIR